MSDLIPNSWKKYYLRKIIGLITFCNNYEKNKKGYQMIEALETDRSSRYFDPSKQLLNKIGVYESFVYRRIEHDEVPVSEVLIYLNQIKSALTQSLNSNITNFCDVKVNNGDIILSDVTHDYVNGLKIKIWNKTGRTPVYVDGFMGIKHFIDENQRYYLIYSMTLDKQNNYFVEKTILINNKLEIIPN